MTDAVITEYAGTRQGPVARFYQYGRDGVRVLDSRKRLKRLYLFDPSSNMMTERYPARRDKILRRFMFDRYGMLEETFSFGERPRTFRYESGGRQIVVREGGEYGAVGKTFTFEENGIAETGWGRHGEIERVYVFEGGNDTITERSGGWYGDVDRTIVFEGINASVFREPEAFLQFLMFTERTAEEVEQVRQDRVTEPARGVRQPVTRGRFAFTGKRHTSSRAPADDKKTDTADSIPDAGPAEEDARPQRAPLKKSSDIPYEERRGGRKS